MGLGPSKEKIRKILEHSITNPISSDQKNIKIEYKFDYTGAAQEAEENSNQIARNGENKGGAEGQSFILSETVTQELDNPALNVKNMNKFPYSAIGTISCKFPVDDNKEFIYTCFLIDTNVVLTLASNLESNSKGGKAKSISCSFSKEPIKWENITIQGSETKGKGNKGKKDKDKDKNQNENLDNVQSKLAVIFFDDSIGKEWIGVEGGKREDFEGRDTFAVFSFEDKSTTTQDEGDKTPGEQKFREIFIGNVNPFSQKAEDDLVKQSPGSPLYYNDYNNGAYAIAILNDSFEFQYFERNTMVFLANMVNKGKLLRKKVNKGIDEDNIVQLDLQRNDFGPLDIKFLTDFDLKNLRILDLSSNSIKPQGAFYLSQGKFSSLESLNLNFNEIGDEGLNHIANGFFSKLNSLYLFHDNISAEGIKYLVKAEFVNNLIILSLSENPNIGDTGVRHMKEHKGWAKLSILNLNYTGLTDVALDYLGKSSMPKLKKLNIQGNKFSENGKANINALRMNHIHVSYRTEAERQKEKQRKEKEKKEKEKEKK
jgi:Ran GTPase-activating protein (RanGAP) involved in mRNA processing and transport